MRLTSTPKLEDDQNFANLDKAIERDLDGIKKKMAAGRLTMRFGPRVVSTFLYAQKLQELHDLLNRSQDSNQIAGFIRKNFDFYEVYGGDRWGEVFVTGYYEPVLEGRLKETGRFTAPILTLPKDAVSVELAQFAQAGVYVGCAQQDVKRCTQVSTAKANRWPVLHGRLVSNRNGVKQVQPFEPREGIVSSPLIKGETHVIAWVDPIDAFFLQIQGSGRIELPTQQIYVTYAGENGYPYVPIGKFVMDKIPKDQMTKQKLEQYLRSLSETDAEKLMDQNQSYVFFEKVPREARTELGVTATSGRTIATDTQLFAKGALAYLEFEKPVGSGFKHSHRFVLDQDTGGAIRGAGRVDLFVGRGAEADEESGAMRAPGRLYYLVPKTANE